MKQITRVNHVGLRVRDLAISRAFYEKLGFEFIVGPVGPEPVAVMRHPAGIDINFILNTSANASTTNILSDEAIKHTGYTHVALEIIEVESVLEQLKSYGIAITEVVKLPDGRVFFFIRDPDENVIELHKPA